MLGQRARPSADPGRPDSRRRGDHSGELPGPPRHLCRGAQPPSPSRTKTVLPYGLKARAFARAFVCVSVFGLALAAAAQPASAHGRRPAASRAHRRLAASITPAPPFQLPGGTDNAPHDVDCLTDAVYYEARGESPAGQAAVAQVVLNRVRHPAFPKTICGVVFQGAGQRKTDCQFSFVCDGSMRATRDNEAWDRAQHIAARALSGVVLADIGGATHFHATRLDTQWGDGLVKVAQVGL